MSSGFDVGRRPNRAERRAAAVKARARAIAGRVRTAGLPTEENKQVLRKLMVWIEQQWPVLMAEVNRTPDTVLCVAMPDADDTAWIKAEYELAQVEGRECRDLSDTAIIWHAMRRSAFLALVENDPSWPPDAVAQIRKGPPPGTTLVAYDGTACGHGLLLSRPMSQGGEA